MEENDIIYEKVVEEERYFRRLRVYKRGGGFLIEEVEKGIITDNHDMVLLTKEEIEEIYKKVCEVRE